MPLPPPGPGVFWKSYEIASPTLELTPIEKPDMSPFLIHVTGKDQITSILSGEGAPTKIPEGHGFLKANVPEHSDGGFNAPVVCLTESPTFALEFFRYRSFARWSLDQRFGVGFEKSALASMGARPVLYVDDFVNRELVSLYLSIQKHGTVLSHDTAMNKRLVDLVCKLYPFLFPLLDSNKDQGFMWEREWRFADPNGLVFSHEDIRIICCPEAEEKGIRDALGNAVDRIQFIRAWREYDDVTDYLRRQQTEWQTASSDAGFGPVRDAVSLGKIIQAHTNVLNTLQEYKEHAVRSAGEIAKITSEQTRVKEEIAKLNQELRVATKSTKLAGRKPQAQGNASLRS